MSTYHFILKATGEKIKSGVLEKNGETKWIVSPESPIGLRICERRDWFYQI